MSLLDAIRKRLPGSFELRPGFGFAVGVTAAADLPACDATREGEERRQVGSGSTPSTVKRCGWNGASWAWRTVPVGFRILTGSTTWNPASISSGRTTQTTVTVTGCGATDLYLASLSSIKDASATNLTLTAAYDGTDTARVTLFNGTSSSVDPPSGTLTVMVFTTS